MTRQVFFKLSRILEPDMVGTRKQHKICSFHHHPNMDTMVENGQNSKNIWNQWSQNNPGKIAKFGRSMLLGKNSELTG